MVELRLEQRLQGRVDPSDILQEAFLEASRRLDQYLKRPALDLFLWLRLLAGKQLVAAHRKHLRSRARDVRREKPLHHGGVPTTTSWALVDGLLERGRKPIEAIIAEETKVKVRGLVEAMEPLDREIIALRNFESLSNAEAAAVLGVSEAAASQRYFRALKRLKEILQVHCGSEGEGIL
jgi:RNA polymerase sigma-70 factor (ECF subfamily)